MQNDKRSGNISFLLVLKTLIIMLFIPACIKEDLANCPPEKEEIHVHFTFSDQADAIGDSTDTPFEIIRLFAFDSAGLFTGEWTDFNPEVTDDYYMKVSLRPGDYTFVAWYYTADSYTFSPSPFVAGQTHLNDGLLLLNRTTGTLSSAAKPLFWGNLTEARVEHTEKKQDFTMPMISDNYKINVTVEGLNPLGNYTMIITDDNGSYRFDNSFAPCEDFRYMTPFIMDEQAKGQASIVTMRLAENRKHPILKIQHGTSESTLFEANLIDLLLNLQDLGLPVDFNTMHEFNIVLRFNEGEGNMSVNILINGWEVIFDDAQIYN